ncbi:MAG TPA: tripartite tricarboxylate transporter substrate-binding protein, partial [Pseudorhodoferax sp.]|nr:tripartite tricarboxylate transporter substrate-binding protein [Pseudorhodoferax sp.]
MPQHETTRAAGRHLPAAPAAPGRRSALLGGLALLLAGALPAHANDYPNRMLTLVVPFAAGGTVDKVARMLQEPLRDRLGQQVLVDNRGGAGGTIGMA